MDKLVWSWLSWLWNSQGSSENDEDEKMNLLKELERIFENQTNINNLNAATVANTNNNINDNNEKNIDIISSDILSIVNNVSNDKTAIAAATNNFIKSTSNILTKILNTTSHSTTTVTTRRPSIATSTTATATTATTNELLTKNSTIIGPEFSSSSSNSYPIFSTLSGNYVPKFLSTTSSSTPMPLLSSTSSTMTTEIDSSNKTSIGSKIINGLIEINNNNTSNNNKKDNGNSSSSNNIDDYYNSEYKRYQQTHNQIVNNINNNENNNDMISFRALFNTEMLSADNNNNKTDDLNDDYPNSNNNNNNSNNAINAFVKSSKDIVSDIVSSSSSTSLSSSSIKQNSASSKHFSTNHNIPNINNVNNKNNSLSSSTSLSTLEFPSKILDYDAIYNYSSSSAITMSSPSSSTSSSSSTLSAPSPLVPSSLLTSETKVSELNNYVNGAIWKSSLTSADDDIFNINDTIIDNSTTNSNNNNTISLLSINQTIDTINLEDIYNNSESFLLDIVLNCNNSTISDSNGNNLGSFSVNNNFNLLDCCNFYNRSDLINGISHVNNSIESDSDDGNSRLGEIIGGLFTINIGGYNQTVNCSSLMTSTTTSSSSISTDNYIFGEYDLETIMQLAITFGTAITLGIIILATVIGNVFVIAAILLERNLQSVSNYLILSLAVADLLVACLVMPLSAVYEVSQEWKLGPELCDMWTSSDVLCCTASILHLVAIALDRYWAVTNIDYIHQRTARRIGIMILIIWGLSFLVSVAPLLGWKDPEWDERVSKELKCIVSQDIGYQIFATASSFYVPLLVILILYWRIFQTARKRIRRRQQAAQTHPEPFMANASCLPLTGIGFRWKVTATPPASGGLIATAAGGSGGIAAAVVTVIGRPLPTISETTTAFTNISSSHTSPEKGSYGNGMDRIENDPPTADISTCGAGLTVGTGGRGGEDGGGHLTKQTTSGMLPTTTSIRPKIVRKKTQTSVDSKRERKAAKTLAIITGAFVCCWLPFFTLAILLPICQCYIPPIVMSLSLWLGYFNSTLNPIIYTIFSPEFRHAFKRLLCGRRNSIRRQTRCVRR